MDPTHGRWRPNGFGGQRQDCRDLQDDGATIQYARARLGCRLIAGCVVWPQDAFSGNNGLSDCISKADRERR